MDVMTEYRRKGQLIDPNTIEVWMVQLIESLSWLSNCRIFHRNIKPHNILLSSDSKIKLIDFRFSTECDTIESSMLPTVLNPIQGPEGYLAPELVEAISNGETVAKYKIGKADIYSLGLSLLQIFTLEKITGLNLPGNYPSILQKINKIKANDWVKNLLSKMLLEDRKERLSFCKCLELIPYGTNTSHF
jgi:serine/threonine protein kinase